MPFVELDAQEIADVATDVRTLVQGIAKYVAERRQENG
jgi:hypothetical protein